MVRSPYALLETIDYIQIDHTSRCNLLCTQCSRVHQGKLNPKLFLTELTLEDYQNIFKPGLFPRLDEVFFCGNYGDASVGVNFLPALEYLKGLGIPCLKVASNGSARSENWWIDLAKILNRKRDRVTFSIDGLADTNHLYRVNSSWEKIMTNVSAFIQAGGRARWDFIVFSHNEHQVDEARELAKKMGFDSFSVKKSNRSLKFTNSIAPSEKKYIGDAILKQANIMQTYGDMNSYLQSAQIDCRFKKERQGVFIDFEAKLWPCCWMASPLWQMDEVDQKPYLENKVREYGENFNSLREKSVGDVLAHPWFRSELVNSWTNNKPKTCSRFCGHEMSYSSENVKNRKIEKLHRGEPLNL